MSITATLVGRCFEQLGSVPNAAPFWQGRMQGWRGESPLVRCNSAPSFLQGGHREDLSDGAGWVKEEGQTERTMKLMWECGVPMFAVGPIVFSALSALSCNPPPPSLRSSERCGVPPPSTSAA
jgi:hypothetical protein